MIRKLPLILFITSILTFSSCGSDDDAGNVYVPQPTSPVVFDIETVPYQNLSEYNLFEGDLNVHEPVYGVIPYEPINALFTDYAHKKRFVWMPDDVKATYDSDGTILNFPTGTMLIKTFYYDNVQPANVTKIIETRVMIKKSDGWIFANYIWNDAQTEATLDLTGGNVNIEWIENNITKSTNYRIPSESECFTCHKNGVDAIPIAVKPQNLNKNYAYSDGSQNQLQKLVNTGYLEDNIPASITTVVDWQDTSQPIDLRMRSYVDVNCAHCHVDNRHCDYRPVRFAFNESDNETNLGVCVEPDTSIPGLTHIVRSGNVNRSVLHFRLNTVQEEYRMPILGRTLIHEEAVTMVEEWINSLTTNCN